VITELATRATTALRAADIDGHARAVLLELAAAATDRLH
jgi:hypothetical protein